MFEYMYVRICLKIVDVRPIMNIPRWVIKTLSSMIIIILNR